MAAAAIVAGPACHYRVVRCDNVGLATCNTSSPCWITLHYWRQETRCRVETPDRRHSSGRQVTPPSLRQVVLHSRGSALPSLVSLPQTEPGPSQGQNLFQMERGRIFFACAPFEKVLQRDSRTVLIADHQLNTIPIQCRGEYSGFPP